MKLLAIGDVFGEPGRRIVAHELPGLIDRLAADFVVVNVENMCHGRGVDSSGIKGMFEAGADCLTSGNHVWSQKDSERLLEKEPRLLRPANYPEPCPGNGVFIGSARNGSRVAVVNLIGRLFMTPVDDPFRVAEDCIDSLRDKADLIAVDFHAEATSEKQALAAHLDGRVAAFWGTHTHVQTADARVLPLGTGYITDLGMSGPYDSIIGMETTAAVQRFLSGRSVRTIPATRSSGLRGAAFDLDDSTGVCRSVERIALGAGGQ